jgi:shikimate kinase
MSHPVIYLVGFMGAGKTTVGTALARSLGREFVDLDVEIEKEAGRPVRRIFEQEGEARFRELEEKALLRASRLPGAVVALGGGAFCSEANREVARSTGISVWLDAPLETLLERCPPDGSRPLLAEAGRMAELLERRLPSYRLADIHIGTAGLTEGAVAGLVRAALRKRGIA